MADTGQQSRRVQPLEVGVVVKPHGVRGVVKVHLHNPQSAVFDKPYGLTLVQSSGTVVDEVWLKGESGGMLLLQIPEVSTREQAEALRGARLLLDPDEISLGEGQYLYRDLQGCTVREGTQVLGVVVELFCAGASDVMVVRQESAERMIPFVEPWVVSVDLERKQIEVTGSEQWEAVAAVQADRGSAPDSE